MSQPTSHPSHRESVRSWQSHAISSNRCSAADSGSATSAMVRSSHGIYLDLSTAQLKPVRRPLAVVPDRDDRLPDGGRGLPSPPVPEHVLRVRHPARHAVLATDADGPEELRRHPAKTTLWVHIRLALDLGAQQNCHQVYVPTRQRLRDLRPRRMRVCRGCCCCCYCCCCTCSRKDTNLRKALHLGPQAALIRLVLAGFVLAALRAAHLVQRLLVEAVCGRDRLVALDHKKCTGLAQIVGQVQASSTDSQSKGWTMARDSGQPCETHLDVEEALCERDRVALCIRAVRTAGHAPDRMRRGPGLGGVLDLRRATSLAQTGATLATAYTMNECCIRTVSLLRERLAVRLHRLMSSVQWADAGSTSPSPRLKWWFVVYQNSSIAVAFDAACANWAVTAAPTSHGGGGGLTGRVAGRATPGGRGAGTGRQRQRRVRGRGRWREARLRVRELVLALARRLVEHLPIQVLAAGVRAAEVNERLDRHVLNPDGHPARLVAEHPGHGDDGARVAGRRVREHVDVLRPAAEPKVDRDVVLGEDGAADTWAKAVRQRGGRQDSGREDSFSPLLMKSWKKPRMDLRAKLLQTYGSVCSGDWLNIILCRCRSAR
jgi:hypothetical protein